MHPLSRVQRIPCGKNTATSASTVRSVERRYHYQLQWGACDFLGSTRESQDQLPTELMSLKVSKSGSATALLESPSSEELYTQSHTKGLRVALQATYIYIPRVSKGIQRTHLDTLTHASSRSGRVGRRASGRITGGRATMTFPVSVEGGAAGGREWEKAHSEDVSSLWTRCSTVEFEEVCSLDLDYEDEQTSRQDEEEEGSRRDGGEEGRERRQGEGEEEIAFLEDVEEGEEKLPSNRTLELVLVEYDSDGDVPVTESVVAAIGRWEGESQDLVGNSCTWGGRRHQGGLDETSNRNNNDDNNTSNESTKNNAPFSSKSGFGLEEKVVVTSNVSLHRSLSAGGMMSVISPECLEVNRRELKRQQQRQQQKMRRCYDNQCLVDRRGDAKDGGVVIC
eukprot:GHVS01029882.1.p1 GENE.GHVS01029882.1~~GHVS01029882.1.p1  ORF type:complete len:394 (+),score=75.21 GHVS01029882.1:1461-2642(+)